MRHSEPAEAPNPAPAISSLFQAGPPWRAVADPGCWTMKRTSVLLTFLMASFVAAAAEESYVRLNADMLSGHRYWLKTETNAQVYEFCDNGLVAAIISAQEYTCWPVYEWRIQAAKTLVLLEPGEFTNLFVFKSISETNAVTTDGRVFSREEVQPLRGADVSQQFRILSAPVPPAAGSRRSR